MFYAAGRFNADISDWNVSAGTDFVSILSSDVYMIFSMQNNLINLLLSCCSVECFMMLLVSMRTLVTGMFRKALTL